MATTKCRHCGGSDIYHREVDARGGYGPNLLPVAGLFAKQPRFRIEVCGTCGLTEWFVPDRFLPKVREVFSNVSG